MERANTVWIFNGTNGRFPSGVFTDQSKAKEWIKKHSLSGVLTEYPIDEGCFDWAVRNELVGVKKETFERKKNAPELIGSFTTASQPHFHFENGYGEDEEEFLEILERKDQMDSNQTSQQS